MKMSKFLMCCMIAGSLAVLGDSNLLAQEKSAKATDEMLNARRGRASPPSPAAQTEVTLTAVGTAGATAKRADEMLLNAWRGHASPPSLPGQIEVGPTAVGTSGTTAKHTDEMLLNAWRGHASPPTVR